ncbi:MAG: site-2 protease family protein [Chlamydiales bacterium]|nr:site-2 protease family protein [Chlamydiales bacterium]
MYLIVAIAVLGILIFVHELGHYFMARHVGMKVEAFGIGFGKSIYKWVSDGVEWRLNWIPFGGYVKIKGAEDDEAVDPYSIPDGFFGRPPIDRIKVSLAGPLANLLVAFITFTALWAAGGRDKTYSEFSNKIGWVERNSQLFADGIRPGDEVTYYGEHAYTNSKDHVIEALTAEDALRIRGEHEDYMTNTSKPFDVTVEVYPHPHAADRALKTAGIIAPAGYLIYQPDQFRQGKSNVELAHALSEGSPLIHSGIEANDRVVWANGELIFSQAQLASLINDPRALATVERDGEQILRRIPRVPVQELRMDAAFREEVGDWQYEAGLQNVKTPKLYLTPYNLTNNATIEGVIPFIDSENHEEAFPAHPYSELEEPLKAGDKIVAINGEPIKFAHQLIARLQEPKVILIVLRDVAEEKEKPLWTQANKEFFKGVNFEQLQKLTRSIGSSDAKTSEGNLHLLKPITPKPHGEFATTPEVRGLYGNEMREERKRLEAIEDPERRAFALELFDKSEGQLHLGPPYFQDKQVVYNPSPLDLFASVFQEIWRTLQAFATGTLSPKFIAGPIGLVSVIQDNWALGIKEGLYWLGVVSLNLGFLNLLPIPVLDGGSIAFSLFELVTGRKLKIKTLEKMIVPFAILLIVFFLFLTYNDVSRIVTRLFG